MSTFVAQKLPAGSYGCAIINPTPKQQAFFKSVIARNHMDDEVYHLRRKAGAFLQCSAPEYYLLEFWLEDYQPLLDWMNQNFEAF